MATPIKVLVTGFGPFLDIKTNPSHLLTLNLPATLLSTSHTPITLIIPPTYIPAAYHAIHTQIPSLIAQHDPDIVLHIGLAVDREYFAVEKSAQREGYHEIPDVERKVVTRGENRTWFGGKKEGPDVLVSGVELEGVVEAWWGGCKGLGMEGKKGGEVVRGKGKAGKGEKGRKGVDVRLSDDVGTYVCGFMYYVGLLEMQRRKGRRDVVFLHIPMLEGDEEVSIGVAVVERLIVAIVDAWEYR
ncbi:peptidase C15, pyroglutamyl peptidase I-like protein [Periconia macrospinosa]|uniref:Peptidase C15, pyroglutamyl peptidase I-like protein n=1 Tax=Periconia macrospinosa TaxID=97972 RepID=A0A2V1DIC9_9PLEO|nr:peptidase C15, pyroglutamyl peptidase I-like protein [Periconia macrospinosa]